SNPVYNGIESHLCEGGGGEELSPRRHPDAKLKLGVFVSSGLKGPGSFIACVYFDEEFLGPDLYVRRAVLPENPGYMIVLVDPSHQSGVIILAEGPRAVLRRGPVENKNIVRIAGLQAQDRVLLRFRCEKARVK